MATPPLICNTAIANSQIQIGTFDRCNFIVTKNSALINSISLCDFSMDIDNFFTQSLRLKGNNAFLLDDAGIGNDFGEVCFVLVGVTYPPAFTINSDKYINFQYRQVTYPIGGLHILTGEPGDSPNRGTVVYPDGSELSSPYFDLGGIVIHNPHSNFVDIKIIIASKGVISSGGSGTSGNPVFSSNLPYFGTSGTQITIP